MLSPFTGKETEAEEDLIYPGHETRAQPDCNPDVFCPLSQAP